MYPLLPVPAAYQGPSGEPGQIVLEGLAQKVTAFHGQIDDEADWHVYLGLAPSVRRELTTWLRSNGFDVPEDRIDRFWCELMVLDDWDTPFIGDDKFFSADVTPAFRLSKAGSSQPAWDLMQQAIDDQRNEQDFSANSALVSDGGRVYLQGPFVNDGAYGFKPEIHPDSIAFAMDASGTTLSARPSGEGWPRTTVTWRVAFFTNSDHHRINGEGYLQKRRTTAWLLDLPEAEREGGAVEVSEDRVEVLDVPSGRRCWGRGVAEGPTWAIVRTGGRSRKLWVSATMAEPDKHGGVVVTDYQISVATWLEPALRVMRA